MPVKTTAAAAAFALAVFLGAAPHAAAQVPQTDTSVLDANGTAHVTRVVPIPKTVSPEAQHFLARPAPTHPDGTIAEQRRAAVAWQNRLAVDMQELYPTHLAFQTIAGVPTRIITPLVVQESKRDRVLINVHGGGFVADWGSVAETIPVANLTQTKVVSVLYRLAPEYPFPAAVEDTVAVYKELLKTYKPQNIGLYGTSAGAILTAEVAVKLRQLGLPLPAALGVFSGLGDFSLTGDSMYIFGLRGLTGAIHPPDHPDSYAASSNLKDPVLSPIYADLKGFPPTLFLTSTRDMLLSGTTILHRAFLRAGVPAQLVVFEGLPHAFWNEFQMPESKEADGIVAEFFNQHLGQ